jgi:hypothetical protein
MAQGTLVARLGSGRIPHPSLAGSHRKFHNCRIDLRNLPAGFTGLVGRCPFFKTFSP